MSLFFAGGWRPPLHQSIAVASGDAVDVWLPLPPPPHTSSVAVCLSVHTVWLLSCQSMGEAHFRTPTPPKPLNQFRCHVKYITRSPQGVDAQNLVGIDSAVPVTDLHIREKSTFCVDFLLTYLSVCLSVKPFLRRGYRPQFWGNFNAKWLKRRDFATISAFLWSH